MMMTKRRLEQRQLRPFGGRLHRRGSIHRLRPRRLVKAMCFAKVGGKRVGGSLTWSLAQRLSMNGFPPASHCSNAASDPVDALF